MCQPCGERVRYEPSSVKLSEAQVTVSELEAHLNYTFTVETHSGVSLLASEAYRPPSRSNVTIFLHYTGEPFRCDAVCAAVMTDTDSSASLMMPQKKH